MKSNFKRLFFRWMQNLYLWTHQTRPNRTKPNQTGLIFIFFFLFMKKNSLELFFFASLLVWTFVLFSIFYSIVSMKGVDLIQSFIHCWWKWKLVFFRSAREKTNFFRDCLTINVLWRQKIVLHNTSDQILNHVGACFFCGYTNKHVFCLSMMFVWFCLFQGFNWITILDHTQEKKFVYFQTTKNLHIFFLL